MQALLNESVTTIYADGKPCSFLCSHEEEGENRVQTPEEETPKGLHDKLETHIKELRQHNNMMTGQKHPDSPPPHRIPAPFFKDSQPNFRRPNMKLQQPKK